MKHRMFHATLVGQVQKYIGATKHYTKLGKVTSHIVSFEVRFPDEKEQDKLRIPPDNPVYDIIRVRYLDGIPILLEYTIMPIYVIPGINQSVLHNSIYEYLSKTLGLKIGSSVRHIRSDKSDAYDQKYIECKKEDPILEVEQVVYLSNGTPFEFSQTRHRYDKGDYIATVIN